MVNKFTMPSFGSIPRSPDGQWVMALSVPSQVGTERCYGCNTRGANFKRGNRVSSEIATDENDKTCKILDDGTEDLFKLNVGIERSTV